MSFYIAQGDTEPGIIFDTINDDGSAEPLDDATEWHLRWHKPDGTSSSITITPLDLGGGVFVHQWQPFDTAILGVHSAQIVVTRGSGGHETFPRDNTFYYWTVTARL